MFLDNSLNIATTNWSAKLEKRVGLVVCKVWRSLAIGTEINVSADDALVANTSDVTILELAKRPVAVDVVV
jgi:hypothetical protein